MTAQYFYGEDAQSGDITPEQIAACESVATLTDWLDAFQLTEDSIRAQLEARKAAEIDEDEWVIPAGHALGWALTGIKRVKRRLKTLGVDLDDNHGGRLFVMSSVIRDLRAKAARWLLDGNFVEAAQAALPAETFAALMVTAANRTAKLTVLPDPDDPSEQPQEPPRGRSGIAA